MGRRLLGFAFFVALAPACNAILGNEERTLAADNQGSGAAQSGGTSGEGGTAGSGAGKGGSTATAGMAGEPGGGGGSADCTDGEAQCDPLGVPESCAGGVWQPQTPCDSATPVCYKGSCVVCAPESFRCVGRRLDQCSDMGAWETVVTCPNSAPVCNSLSGDCVNLMLQGGLTTLGPEQSPSPSFIVRGELSIQQRACNAGTTVCIRGGIVP